MKKLFAFLIALTLAVTCASSVFANEIVYCPGDAINDGTLTKEDAIIIQKYVVGYYVFHTVKTEKGEFPVADVNFDANCDGEIDFKDVAWVLRKVD